MALAPRWNGDQEQIMQNQAERRRAMRPRRRRSSSTSAARERHIYDSLRSLGVDDEVVEETVEKVANLGEDPVDWLLAGLEAGLARGSHATGRSAVRRREIERLMEGFSNELVKLDEVVDVLATFVNRMRGQAENDPPEGMLH